MSSRVQINILLHKKQKAALEKAAKAAGVSVSDLARGRLMWQELPPVALAQVEAIGRQEKLDAARVVTGIVLDFLARREARMSLTGVVEEYPWMRGTPEEVAAARAVDARFWQREELLLEAFSTPRLVPPFYCEHRKKGEWLIVHLMELHKGGKLSMEEVRAMLWSQAEADASSHAEGPWGFKEPGED